MNVEKHWKMQMWTMGICGLVMLSAGYYALSKHEVSWIPKAFDAPEGWFSGAAYPSPA